MNIALRQYQYDAVNSIRQCYADGYFAPLLVLPTGSGKTVVFCDIAERVSVKGKIVYILVHRNELLSQTSAHLDTIGVEHGIISPGHVVTGDRVQVASVQTLVKRLGVVPKPDIIIIDEAHHSIAKSWKTIIAHWAGVRVLGVTATPMRLDGKGLGCSCGGCFDILVEGPTVIELTNQKFLSPSVVYAPPSMIDMNGVKSIDGDYDKKETGVRIDKPIITGCAIDHYIKICNGLPAVAFCASVKHAEHVAEQFNSFEIPSASIDGKLSYSVRRHRIKSLANGSIKVLTSCDIISEGIDIPIISASILLRPTKSLAIYLQQCGRALRPAKQIGKTNAFIIDHVGNCFRHGMPDGNMEWSLDGCKKTKKTKRNESITSIRQCKKCYAVFSSFTHTCPQCGAKYMAQVREIREVHGDLVKVNEAEVEKYKIQKKVEVGAAKTLEELIAIGKRRGYKPGWAINLYNIRRQRKWHVKNPHVQKM